MPAARFPRVRATIRKVAFQKCTASPVESNRLDNLSRDCEASGRAGVDNDRFLIERNNLATDPVFIRQMDYVLSHIGVVIPK